MGIPFIGIGIPFIGMGIPFIGKGIPLIGMGIPFSKSIGILYRYRDTLLVKVYLFTPLLFTIFLPCLFTYFFRRDPVEYKFS